MTFTPSIVSTTPDTDYELPLMDLRLRPGAILQAGRLTPGLFVSVEVFAGAAAIAVEGYDFDLAEGEAVDLRDDADPSVWNTGGDVARLVVALRLPVDATERQVTAVMEAVEAYANGGADPVRDEVSTEAALAYAA